MSGLYHGHLAEYPRIRVDHFSTVKEDSIPLPQAFVPQDGAGPKFFPVASLYLLSHCHTDHTQGLDSVTGGLHIICSQETKDIILNLETAAHRRARDSGELKRAVKPYGRLRTKEGVDLLDAHPYFTPIPLLLTSSPPQRITLTLLPANHCPGSTMFLIEGDAGTVLHTGDVRCEGSFVSQMVGPGGGLERFGLLLPKKDAVQGMMDLIAMYPADTRFYVNAWTWGYEELLMAICEAYPDERIHLDRYKRSIYKLLPSVSEPLVRYTGDPTGARFHACDLGNRCAEVGFSASEHGGWVPKSGGRVVNLNPAELRVAHWDVYRADLERKFADAWEGKGDWPTNLVIPLARHSPLPELRHLLYSLRPETVYPNTLLSKTSHPIEYLCLPYIFPALPSSTVDRLRNDISSWCAVNFQGGEAEAWRGVEDWIEQSEKRREKGEDGEDGMKMIEKGLEMTGLVVRGTGGVGVGRKEGWAGKEVGGKGKLARVVGTVLRMCNAGNGDPVVESEEDGADESKEPSSHLGISGQVMDALADEDDEAELAAAIALSVHGRPSPAGSSTTRTTPLDQKAVQRDASVASPDVSTTFLKPLARLRSLTPDPTPPAATDEDLEMLEWAEKEGSRFVFETGFDGIPSSSSSAHPPTPRSSISPSTSKRSRQSTSGVEPADLSKAEALRLRQAFSNGPVARMIRERRRERERERARKSPEL